MAGAKTKWIGNCFWLPFQPTPKTTPSKKDVVAWEWVLRKAKKRTTHVWVRPF